MLFLSFGEKFLDLIIESEDLLLFCVILFIVFILFVIKFFLVISEYIIRLYENNITIKCPKCHKPSALYDYSCTFVKKEKGSVLVKKRVRGELLPYYISAKRWISTYKLIRKCIYCGNEIKYERKKCTVE